MSSLRFHILGAGSIGLLYAYHLRALNVPVTLMVRDVRNVDRFQAGGSLVTLEHTLRGSHERLSLEADIEPIYSSTSTSPRLPTITNLLVATKSNDVVRAVRSVQHRLTKDSSLILLQNGILAVYKELWRDVLCKLQPTPPKVIIASTTHGCYTTQPFTVFHAGMGSAAFAEVDSSLVALTDPGHKYKWQMAASPALQCLLNMSELRAYSTASHQELLQQLHTKLAVNCCINPLTALLGCLNGQLISQQYTRDTMHQVCEELHQLFGPELSQSTEELYSVVHQVAQATARNKSSMYQDTLNGRLTEIEYLNGYVMKQGAQQQVPTPVNNTLYNLMKVRERLSAEILGTKHSSLSDV